MTDKEVKGSLLQRLSLKGLMEKNHLAKKRTNSIKDKKTSTNHLWPC